MIDVTPAEQYAALVAGNAVMASGRDVITAVGPDTLNFLQGQLSQDVKAMANGESEWTLHLQPNGRLIGLARLTRIDDETVMLDTEYGVGERIRTGLARFLIRTKCVLTMEEGVPSVTWPNAPDELRANQSANQSMGGSLPLIVSSLPFCEGVDVVGVDRWPADFMPIAASVSDEVSEAFRIERGVPHDGAEFIESTIPSETSITEHAVTFGKGCYVGQELVERINSRGRVVKSHRRCESIDVASTATDALPSSLDIKLDGDVVGHLTSLAIHPLTGTFVGIALIRSSAQPDGLTVDIDGREVAFRLVA